MAKRRTQTPGTYKQQSLVSGKTVSDIMSMDVETFNKLNRAEMAKVTGRLVSAANKSMRRLEDKGYFTPAYRTARESGGYFTAKGKNLDQLRAEFVRAKNYLNSKTANVRGYEKVRSETIKTLAKKNIQMTKDQYDTFWKSYEQLKEADSRFKNNSLKYSALEKIEWMIQQNMDVDQITVTLKDKYEEIYIESQQRLQEAEANGGVSDLID